MTARVLPALALLVVVAGGCQICGQAHVPCSNDNPFQECPDELVCVDGLCSPPGADLPICAAPPADDEEVRVAAFDVEQEAGRGFGAMPDELFGLAPVVARDFTCAPSCPGAAGSRARAPVPGDVGALVLDQGRVDVSDDGGVADEAVLVELIFRAPTGNATIASATDDAGGGWVLRATSNSEVFLDAGAATVFVSDISEMVWTHLLCLIDPARLDAGQSAGLLCSVDGGLPLVSAPTGAWRPAPDAPLRVGEDVPSDAAVALVRMWRGRGDLSDDDAIAQRQLVDEAQRRLLSFLGVSVITTGDVLATNLGPLPRVVSLPPTDLDPKGTLALVGARWPRVVEVNGEAGVLLEDLGLSALDRLGEACTSKAKGPTGRTDACRVPFEVSLIPTSADTSDGEPDGLAEGTKVTFSAWTQKQSASTSLTATFLEEGGDEVIICSLGQSQNACTDSNGGRPRAATLLPLGDAQQFSFTFVAPFPIRAVRFDGAPGDVVWSPQLEAGDRATSPIPFLLPDGVFTNGRNGDAILIGNADLGVTSALTLQARVLEAHGTTTGVLVVDHEDAEDTVELAAVFDGGEASVRMKGKIGGKDIDAASADRPVLPGTIAGHIGDVVEKCSPCAEVTPVSTSETQPELVLFFGPNAVLRRGSVHARGTTPRPLPLSIVMGTPALEPCVDDAAPLFTFAACQDGLCDTHALWDGGSRAAENLVVGAFPGELATVGPFTTDLLRASGSDAILLEARFATPVRGEGGTLLDLVDEKGSVAALLLEQDGADAWRVSPRVGASVVNLDLPRLGPGEWNQLLCLFDDGVQCMLNLSAPTRRARLPELLRSGALVKAVAGEAHVDLAAARAWSVRRPASDDDAVRVLSERALASFGFNAQARRGGILAVEKRGTAGFASVLDLDDKLALRRIGPGWPRVQDARGRIEYVVEPAKGSDGASDADFVSVEGPHPSLAAREVDSDLTFQNGGAASVISLFVNVDGGGTASLASGTSRVTLPGGVVEGGAGVDDYGAWQRLWVRADAGQLAQLIVDGPVVVSTPQRDEGALFPFSPDLDDKRAAGDGVLLRSVDLASRHASTIAIDVAPDDVSGRFVSFTDGNTDSPTTVGVGFDGGLQMQQAVGLGVGTLPRVDPPVSLAVDDLPRPLLMWFKNRSVVLKDKGGATLLRSSLSLPSATSIVVGNSDDFGPTHLRFRALESRRGDL